MQFYHLYRFALGCIAGIFYWLMLAGIFEVLFSMAKTVSRNAVFLILLKGTQKCIYVALGIGIYIGMLHALDAHQLTAFGGISMLALLAGHGLQRLSINISLLADANVAESTPEGKLRFMRAAREEAGETTPVLVEKYLQREFARTAAIRKRMDQRPAPVPISAIQQPTDQKGKCVFIGGSSESGNVVETAKEMVAHLPFFQNPTRESVASTFAKDWNDVAMLSVMAGMSPPAVAKILQDRVVELDSFWGIRTQTWTILIMAVVGVILFLIFH